jgi:hypothetical protein
MSEKFLLGANVNLCIKLVPDVYRKILRED